MTTLDRIARWYLDQCDGEWEHARGIAIETLDNPGWSVQVDLRGTPLQDKEIQSIKELRTDSDWIHCSAENGCFKGAGGAGNLTEILEQFLSWAGY